MATFVGKMSLLFSHVFLILEVVTVPTKTIKLSPMAHIGTYSQIREALLRVLRQWIQENGHQFIKLMTQTGQV